jgi:hypothetical protein
MKNGVGWNLMKLKIFHPQDVRYVGMYVHTVQTDDNFRDEYFLRVNSDETFLHPLLISSHQLNEKKINFFTSLHERQI